MTKNETEKSYKFLDRKHQLYSLGGIVFILIMMTYYFLLFKPSKNILQKQIEKQFISKVKLKATLFDNAVAQFIQGSKSMSSRSMIRKKIQEHYDQRLSFSDLKNYTLPKYRDGVNALDNFVYARRNLLDKTLLEVGNLNPLFLDVLKKYDNNENLSTGFILNEKTTFTYVYSPIKIKDNFLGYDIIFFDNFQNSNKIAETGIDFKINYHASDFICEHEKKMRYFDNKANYMIKSSYSNACYSFTITQDILFKELRIFYLNQIITIIILLLLIFVMFFLMFRREKFLYLKKVIENEKKYKWIIEKSKDAIAIRQAGRLIFVNDALSQLLDYSKEQLLTLDYNTILTTESIKKIRQLIQENEINKVSKYLYETVLIKKDGTNIYVEISENIVEFNDKKAYFLIIRDITRLRELVKILKDDKYQTKKLGDFISICANCFQIKDSNNEWIRPDKYIKERLPEINFSHGICPKCLESLYGLNFEDEED